MTEFKYAGTVSHGTMLDGDLIPAFMSVLEDVDEIKARALKEEFADVLTYMETDQYGYNTDPGDDMHEAMGELTSELFDTLDEAAPDGYYFGANEGDGSDYGFWKTEDEFDHEDHNAGENDCRYLGNDMWSCGYVDNAHG